MSADRNAVGRGRKPELSRLWLLSRASSRGFTLLELIVVLLILGVLAAIAIPTFNRIQLNSVESSLRTEAEALARDAQGIAFSAGAGAVTTDHLQVAADESYGDDAPTAANLSILLSKVSGSIQCRVIVASVSGVAVAGEVACTTDGSEPVPLAPSGVPSGGGGGGGGGAADFGAGSSGSGGEFDLSGATGGFAIYQYEIGAAPWFAEASWGSSNRYLYRYVAGNVKRFAWLSDGFGSSLSGPALADFCSTGSPDGTWKNVLLFSADPGSGGSGTAVCP